jgi:hypothetical protein
MMACPTGIGGILHIKLLMMPKFVNYLKRPFQLQIVEIAPTS